jgi:predicted transcriptional regulator
MEEFNNDFDREHAEQVIEHLIELGAASWDGMDADGERMFTFDMDIIQEEIPELYTVIMEDLDATMMELYQKGLAELEYDEELNAHFKITEEGKALLEELGFDFFGNSEDQEQ